MAKIVNSWNDWDPLKRVIVGLCDNSVIPPEELEGIKTIDIGDRAHGILLEGLRKRKAALAAQ